MIQLLGFDQCVYPLFLSFLKSFHEILLVNQVLLIAGEVMSTGILDLVELLIIYLLQVVTMRLSLRCLIVDKVAQFLDLTGHQSVEVFLNCFDLIIMLSGSRLDLILKEIKLLLPRVILLLDISLGKLIDLLYFLLQLLLVTPCPVIKH